jgi:hypothetical protein
VVHDLGQRLCDQGGGLVARDARLLRDLVDVTRIHDLLDWSGEIGSFSPPLLAGLDRACSG